MIGTINADGKEASIKGTVQVHGDSFRFTNNKRFTMLS